MRFKSITILLGAVAASTFSVPAKFSGPADAADAVSQPKPEMVKVPEFVPVINFSEFVMAMQTFSAQNPPAARMAAEALSAKFASNGDAQQIEIHKPNAQMAAQPTKPASVIVTRPVEVASISEAESQEATVPAIPAVPDPTAGMKAVSDPVKIITGYPKKRAEAAPHRHKVAEKKIASASRERVEKHFQPAMGLGMVIDSAEDAPPMSSLVQKKRSVSSGSRGIE